MGVYFVSGRGGQLNEGLGAAIQSYPHHFLGRAVSGDFEKLTHTTQVQTIQDDLATMPTGESTLLVAHSYGAYLLLHALIKYPQPIDRLVLISPVTGSAMGNGRFFRPPGTKALSQALTEQAIPLPNSGVLVTGEHDWQSPAERGRDIASQLGMKFSLVPNAGHRLPVEFVKKILNECLAAC